MVKTSNIYLGGLSRCCIERIQTSDLLDTPGAAMSCPACLSDLTYGTPPGMDSPGWGLRDRMGAPAQGEKTMEPKPGLQTTEFWGKVIVQLVLLVNAVFNTKAKITLDQAAMIVAAMEAVYGLSRSIAKSKSKETA